MRWLIAISGVLMLAIVSVVTVSAIAHKQAPLCDSIAGRTVSETAAVRLVRARHSGLRNVRVVYGERRVRSLQAVACLSTTVRSRS